MTSILFLSYLEPGMVYEHLCVFVCVCLCSDVHNETRWGKKMELVMVTLAIINFFERVQLLITQRFFVRHQFCLVHST